MHIYLLLIEVYRISKRFAKKLCLAVIMITGIASLATAEENGRDFFSISSLQDELRELRINRDIHRTQLKTSQEELRAAENEIREIELELPGIRDELAIYNSTIRSEQAFQEFIDRNSAEIDSHKARLEEPGVLQDEIDRKSARIATLEQRIQDAKDRREEQLSKQTELEQTIQQAEARQLELRQGVIVAQRLIATSEQSVFAIDAKIEVLLGQLDEQSDFRFWITLAFILLVGGVIFWVARITNDHADVRQTVFAGDKGLQFVTLFALIIAIILFGIVGILSGRELSALLGGISGFILGRAGQQPDSRVQAASEPHPPQQTGPDQAAALQKQGE